MDLFGEQYGDGGGDLRYLGMLRDRDYQMLTLGVRGQMEYCSLCKIMRVRIQGRCWRGGRVKERCVPNVLLYKHTVPKHRLPFTRATGSRSRGEGVDIAD